MDNSVINSLHCVFGLFQLILKAQLLGFQAPQGKVYIQKKNIANPAEQCGKYNKSYKKPGGLLKKDCFFRPVTDSAETAASGFFCLFIIGSPVT